MKRILFALFAALALFAPVRAAAEKVTHRFAAAIKGRVVIIGNDGKVE
jgi:hypothetical protein